MTGNSESMKKIRLKGKVCLLGDAAVGKTSLIRRYVLDKFDDKYISTMGTKVTLKELHLEYPEKKANVELTLLIWDIVGQKKKLPTAIVSYERYMPQKKYFKGANGALLVCDITRHETFDSLDEWINAMKREVGMVPLVFITNKTDLRKDKSLNLEDIENYANGFDSKVIQTSAKTGKNVEQAFYELGNKMASAILDEK
ncbi:MAG: GTP-binding protein [Thermoplasmata archaeon]|nr:MAG: GTP-binding protein [Thermoplasmata archaeon]